MYILKEIKKTIKQFPNTFENEYIYLSTTNLQSFNALAGLQ